MINRAPKNTFAYILLTAILACAGAAVIFWPKREAELRLLRCESSGQNTYAVLALRNLSGCTLYYNEDRSDPDPDSVQCLASIRNGKKWTEPGWDWKAVTNSIQHSVAPGAVAEIKVLLRGDVQRVGLRLRIFDPSQASDSLSNGIVHSIRNQLGIRRTLTDRWIDVWCPTLIEKAAAFPEK